MQACGYPWTAGAAAWTTFEHSLEPVAFVFSLIERLWRSLKYEAVYLHELTDGFRTEQVIRDWIDFYNGDRPHSALGGRTPAEAYGAGRPVDMMAKTGALPTSPQAQQRQKDLINRILAA